MVFSSLYFLFFYLVVVVATYYFLPPRLRNAWLFVASVLFYGYGEPVYILLLFVSITLNYLCGLGIAACKTVGKKRLLFFCVAANLLLLGFFKYTGLLLRTLSGISAFSAIAIPDIVLPIGISFYTFQTMSYVIDVYKGNCGPQKNFITFGTYVALFPQLIAGPIVRYVDVEKQLMYRRETLPMFNDGVKLFTVGMAKKLLLANPMGAAWAVLKDMPDSGVLGHWIGILAFTLQIYFDFSGYSDMARGLGNMFGFSFVKNFDYPYISQSITEFWRRWHISLGTWFREYVYIPLGGNRKGRARQCLNLFIVWGLTGLWHGASWNFVIWGLYFGLLLTVEKFFLLKPMDKLCSAARHVYAMFFVIIGWVIFDFTDINAMFGFIGGMFGADGLLIGGEAACYVLAYLPLMLVAVAACLPVWKKLYYRLSQQRSGWAVDAVATTVILLLCTAALVTSTYNPFLYYRF